MERAEIAELFCAALTNLNEIDPLRRFLASSVEWILSDADPQTAVQESAHNTVKFSGREGFWQLVLYLRDSLRVVSGDLTGCISRQHLVFVFGRVRLKALTTNQVAETNIAAKLTFQGSKIIKGQIRISWPLVPEADVL
jgi:hypothetical protein